MEPLSATDIAARFTGLFRPSYLTEMRGGGDEPLYVPATPSAPALVLYTRDYPASALHEAAHWCLAGRRRRQLIDYGYRYVPPPRSPAQQRTFLRHELQVQALESLFAAAAGLPFRVSHDDPAAREADVADFATEVLARAREMAARGLSPRAAALQRSLAQRSSNGSAQRRRGPRAAE